MLKLFYRNMIINQNKLKDLINKEDYRHFSIQINFREMKT